LRLSKRTEYGLRAVVSLARLEPRVFVQSRDLAKQEALPIKFLESILLALAAGGIPGEQSRQRWRVSAVTGGPGYQRG